jgi:methylthioribose-1-phosphate isomerase
MIRDQQSPLFEPVLWDGNGFKILDELLVPEQIEYIRINHVAQAVDAVRHMKTRAFGQVLTFLYSGALLASAYRGNKAAPLREQIGTMTEAFCNARPTFDFRGLGAFFEEWFAKLSSNSPVGESIACRAREFARQIVQARQARAKRAASILPNPAQVMTHCNVSGELVEVARHCHKLQKEFTVIATETRPYLQGARLTAWELARAGVSTSLIPDCAIAQVMAGGEVNALIVGADRCARNGDVINKVGTYPLALMAREYQVPFYALVQPPGSLEHGVDAPIEERPVAELLMFREQSITPISTAEIGARYPAFDITPGELITRLIGFDDAYTPESFRKTYGGSTTSESIKSPPEAKYILIYGVPPPNQYAFFRAALKAEHAEAVLVPEMRPALWGAQVVAPELNARNIPATLISDNTMGTLFAQGEIRKLCLFYESLSSEGPVGISGSLLAVRLARLHGVEIELFDGAHAKNQTRDRDISTFLGNNICPAGVTIRTIEPEVIPWTLLRG